MENNGAKSTNKILQYIHRGRRNGFLNPECLKKYYGKQIHKTKDRLGQSKKAL